MRKLSFVLIGLLAVVGLEAQAADFGAPSPTSRASTLTRAEVQRETVRALAAREVMFGDVTLLNASTGPGLRSRGDVRAETLMALKDRGLMPERGLYAN